jgi:hypothetical protein
MSYLVSHPREGDRRFLDLRAIGLPTGALDVGDEVGSLRPRVRKCADLPTTPADACVVRMAELRRFVQGSRSSRWPSLPHPSEGREAGETLAEDERSRDPGGGSGGPRESALEALDRLGPGRTGAMSFRRLSNTTLN